MSNDTREKHWTLKERWGARRHVSKSVIGKQPCPLSVQFYNNYYYFSHYYSQMMAYKGVSQMVSHEKHVMMGWSKNFSQDLGNLIVGKQLQMGLSIIKLLNILGSTVGDIIWKWKEHHFTVNGHSRVLARSLTEVWKERSKELSKSQGPLLEFHVGLEFLFLFVCLVYCFETKSLTSWQMWKPPGVIQHSSLHICII